MFQQCRDVIKIYPGLRKVGHFTYQFFKVIHADEKCFLDWRPRTNRGMISSSTFISRNPRRLGANNRIVRSALLTFAVTCLSWSAASAQQQPPPAPRSEV